MSSIILQGVEKAELLAEFRQICKEEFKNSAPPLAPVAEPDRFIDQKAVAEIFGVSGVSVWQWEKAGLLKSYRIGNLKRFKYSEVMNSPKAIERNKKGGQKQ